MKLQRLTKLPALWHFALIHLPATLYAKKEQGDYGWTGTVNIKETGKHWYSWGPMVAQVRDDEIEVFMPKYFSDIQKLVEDYEDMSGKEVTVKLWEEVPREDNKKHA
jgi:hypothetical protein